MAARNTFIIDPRGVIRKIFVKVNPNPHSQEVLAAIDELKKSQRVAQTIFVRISPFQPAPESLHRRD